ncbi:flagellar basal body P-ring formation protein FlgA [Vibrio sp. OCN044]|uniref:Flagellar basal body P-ring formation protein FlgA n=1 Tax=Vibrio tetraodonis subsp. pristinus TaxID=2695891 RepID=A0A6L8LPE9_9VIBR|nr:flagellar basal body P-ring formation chaperone FlgA [Vibrio tetraodonis]MYM57911.1 flagellar basal body P-ring formation protein FlgA [Vibrio tetraodonis subsp. pristinus]
MTYSKEGKCHFRITEGLKSRGNRIVSPLSLIVWLGLSLLSNTASATENSLNYQAIYQAIEANFKTQVSNQARTRQWGKHTVNYQIRIPASADHLPLCPEPLIIEGSDSKTLPVGTLKRSVSCQSNSADWRINVTIKSELGLYVVVTKTGVGRKQALTANDLKLEWRTLTKEQDFLTQIEQASGKMTLRRIRSGQVLDSRQLKSQPLVEKGNQVIISAAKDGFMATTKGLAQEEGALGQQIEVKNISSGKVIRAVVVGLNQVETQF